MSLNTWMFTGNVSQDPVMRKTSTGKDVCKFSVAINNYNKGAESQAMFVGVSAWEGLATIASNLRKGTRVVVNGKVEPPSAYIRKTDNSAAASMNVTASEIVFFNPNSGSGNFAGVNSRKPAQTTDPAQTQQDNGGFSNFDPNGGGWFGNNTPY